MGLIPAHAGKTPSRRSRTDPPRAHPRSRGENTRKSVHGSITAGSSPLTRGKPPQRRSRCPARWAHPRSRGENTPSRSLSGSRLGSSPLTRGKLDDLLGERPNGGLIPAHAGKTAPKARDSPSMRAHPRSRGENWGGLVNNDNTVGSSPLTRGKQPARFASWRAVGLIPAHAGKTLISNGEIPKGRAHPRSRGENKPGGRTKYEVEGSSPLTRGKLRLDTLQRRTGGLIPAHAGKTTRKARRRRSDRAHPRSRGENGDRLSACP